MNKSDNAYKSISEVAKILNLVNLKNGKPNTHTIRFWEKQFKQIKPKKLAGNRRYYDKNAVIVLKKIKLLRLILIKLECILYTPSISNKILRKIKPDLVLVSALCGFKYNELFAREAIKNNTFDDFFTNYINII